MSPAAQFASVATLTFAVLGFTIVAFAGLGITLALLLYGFVPTQREVVRLDEDPAPPEAPTPEEALRRDG